VIGCLAGEIYRPFCRRGKVVRVFGSVATLYAAGTMFGLACGLCDAIRPVPSRLLPEVVLQTAAATTFGTTLYILFLWPLSYLNHSLVCRLSKAE
jgi:hypothetical protein